MIFSGGAKGLRKMRAPIWIVGSGVVLLAPLGFAQSSLEGRITTTIGLLTRIVNVLIAGFIVWSGLLIAKGESSGFQKLVYGVVGLIVANAAYLIVNYFS
jgi:hypothetical protein